MFRRNYLKAPLIFFIFSTFTRLSLSFYNLSQKTICLSEIPGILGMGLLFDLRPVLLLTLLFAISIRFTPRFIQKKIQNNLFFEWIGLLIVLFVLTFQMFAEWIFWGDMDCRFNFIAIDYLVYTHEVVNNILQSYPMKTYFSIMGLIAAVGATILLKIPKKSPQFDLKNIGQIALLSVSSFFLPIQHWSQNNFAQELSENGTCNLIHAFFHNQLNYHQFYKTIDPHHLKKGIQTYLKNENVFHHKDPIQRWIPSFKEEKLLNVVLITVESLSQEFLDKYPQTWCPFIQKLKPESISFNDHYATGTRTVRGLEALALSVPPTPGSSILRRPHYENLFSASSVFKPKGYEMFFWYGGYGYFDNMNAFFEKNGFLVRDRLFIPSDKVAHETIWGVSDEHLFDAFLDEIQKREDTTKPFFSLIMTTSNHRPYTFPDNRIPFATGTREAAVRYTDWAIQRFFEKAKQCPWFDNTLFVITADHCASSAGKMKIDPAKYHTPCLFYAPKHIAPKMIETRTSQIDVLPTILGLLGIGYESRFYGIDQVHQTTDRPVVLGTYQRLGYFGKKEMVILSPKREVNIYQIEGDCFKEQNLANSYFLNEAIGVYQSASERYSKGLMDERISD
ncbi:MAG: alkaline phosphatase family protein [Chlamydiae bacterium]|nr:alkaline phosphatase family protein [Chlamydiota bacterium]